MGLSFLLVIFLFLHQPCLSNEEKCNVSWRNARQYHHEEGQKKIFAAVRSFRPSEGQKKSQKRAEGQNDLAKAQNFFFVIPNDEKCRALTHELHFSTLSKFFPFQKVNFPVRKIPLGSIYFLSLFARKTRKRSRMKKRAKGRKCLFHAFVPGTVR